MAFSSSGPRAQEHAFGLVVTAKSVIMENEKQPKSLLSKEDGPIIVIVIKRNRDLKDQ